MTQLMRPSRSVFALEWDDAKCAANEQRHGLHFRDCEFVFMGHDEYLTFEDLRKDYGEHRHVTMGRLRGRLVVIVHTERGDRNPHHQHEIRQ